MLATCRVPRRARRCGRTDPGGVIGREAVAGGAGVPPLTAGMVASSAGIKPGEARHSEARAVRCRRDVPRPSTCRAAAPGPMPVARPAARPSMPAWWRAAQGSSPTLRSTQKREPLDARDAAPLDAPCRGARTNRRTGPWRGPRSRQGACRRGGLDLAAALTGLRDRDGRVQALLFARAFMARNRVAISRRVAIASAV
jgi:hypothetical protein